MNEAGNSPLYLRQALRFSCTGCGTCCTGSDEYGVFVTGQEIHTIRRTLDIGEAWLRRRYIRREEGGWLLRSDSHGRCVFLRPDKGCRIYAARPVQCRTYPFWPELMRHTKDWRREGQRCEGIGRGPVVAKTVIIRALRQQQQVNLCYERERTEV
ncbi:MAG: YkgJ family cysteine cluster protein [Gammaproteobacteria bacterium]|nr:YkgJ family cysteine cluster protein [Gammaproteobacteria bacterium]